MNFDVVVADSKSGVPDFIGAPYEFWMGANVPVGTSVGQIRVSNVFGAEQLTYDLLHSYREGGIVNSK